MDRRIIAAAVLTSAMLTCLGDGRSDDEIRAAVVWDLAPRCGGASEKDRLYRNPSQIGRAHV